MKISGYKLDKRIGKGGMAMVYLAIQESLNRPVALKVMNPMFSDTREFSERFLDEGRILASLHHSHIITIHDIGISDGLYFISMELVEGGDLGDKIKQGITPETAIEYTQAIASSLQAAHSAHIVHRDVKPANILFRQDGTLLLTDFGIAKQLASAKDLTVAGSMLGSPHYLSPEQALGKTVDGRADIYSLGIILYEMLLGARPFIGECDVDIALKHITEVLPPLPDEFSVYQNLLNAMTARDPDDRFPSMGSLLEALKEFSSSGEWSGNIAQIQDATTPPPSENIDLNEELFIDRSETETMAADIGDTVTLVADETADTIEATAVDATLPDMDLIESQSTDQSEAKTMPGHADDTAMLATDDTTPADGELPIQQEQPAPKKKTGIITGTTVVLIPVLAIAAAVLFLPHQNQPAKKPVTAKQTHIEQPADAQDDIEAERQRQIQQQLAQLLKKAEIALNKYHLTSPENDNAYLYYQRALQLDPGNNKAQLGSKNIADKYYILAKAAEKNWDYDMEKTHIERGLKVKPGHSALLKLQRELKKTEGDASTKTKKAFSGIKKLFD